MKFIYVFNTEDRDKLKSYGFALLKADDHNSTYVFVADDTLKFALNDITYATSNTLTF